MQVFLITFGLLKVLYKTAKVRNHRSIDNTTNTLKGYRQISKTRCFEKYCSCDKACQFSTL